MELRFLRKDAADRAKLMKTTDPAEVVKGSIKR